MDTLAIATLASLLVLVASMLSVELALSAAIHSPALLFASHAYAQRERGDSSGGRGVRASACAMSPDGTKDMPYHELMEALNEVGCAVCRRAEESVEDAIAAVVREQVNDPGFREQLLDSRGFCRHHAWRVVRTHDILGIGILHRALLDHLARRRTVRRVGQCPLCLTWSVSETHSIETLVKHLGDATLQDQLATSDGLCQQHFERAMTLSRGSPILAQAQAVSRTRLLEDLDEFLRKQDYRFMQEPDRGEQNAWLRAVAAVSGLDVDALPRARSRKLPPPKSPRT